MRRVTVDREQLARQMVEAAYLEGDFLLASGRRSRYYFDKYRFETRPDLLGPVAGCRITRLIGVIDREEGAAEAARAAGYELVSVFSRSELERYLDRSA